MADPYAGGRQNRALEAVMIGLDYRIGLLYRLEKDGTRFQIFLQPDGTAAEHAIWEEEPPEAGGRKNVCSAAGG